MVPRSEVGRFIAENLRRDPDAKVFGKRTVELLAGDLVAFLERIGPALLDRLFGSDAEATAAHRNLEQKLTKLLGEDNLIGSAGEWGLLFAFFANQPGPQTVAGEPALAVDALTSLFIDKRLPAGFATWKKWRGDWVVHTTALLIAAGRAYRAV
jgi:hypothetical protein